MTGQNMAGGSAIFDVGKYNQVKAELSFYLQGTRCLAIRLGLHTDSVSSTDLDLYLSQHKNEILQLIKSDIERLRKERRRLVFGETD
jgi:hypothetical protein